MATETQWWQAPDEGEEFHTPRVWSQIAAAAEAAGDNARAAEAREAADQESRSN